MHRLFTPMLLGATLVTFWMSPASAVTILQAELSGASERPSPVVSPGTGFVTVLLNDAEDTLTINLSFSSLLAPQTAAHIHGLGDANAVAPVRIEPPTLPLGQLVDVDVLIPDPLPGTPVLSRADFVQGLKDGLTYFNVHTSLFPAGEIRGQLEVVPEPATLLLWGGTMAALGFAARRRSRKRDERLTRSG
jgi:hypothetical protein